MVAIIIQIISMLLIFCITKGGNLTMGDLIVILCFAPFYLLTAIFILLTYRKPPSEEELRNLDKLLDFEDETN